MLAYSAALLLTALLVRNLSDTVSGFSRILTAPAQLTIDYFKLGGVGGTFLNAGLVGLAAAGLLFISRAELTGVSLMALFSRNMAILQNRRRSLFRTGQYCTLCDLPFSVRQRSDLPSGILCRFSYRENPAWNCAGVYLRLSAADFVPAQSESA